MGGLLQNQGQEFFTSSLPTSNSSPNTNTMMNLSISSENIDNSLKPLSLNSGGVMMSWNLDPLFHTRTSRPYLGSVGGSNSSPTAIGSAYTSATALLQKAAEMGTKISDNTIAPILLRGFTGYSTSSMNSSGPVQESSSGVGNNMGLIFLNNSGLYAGDQQMLDTNMDPRPYNISQTGLFQSPMFVNSENGKSDNITGGEAFMGGGEKLTVDFLGIEPAAHSNIGKKRSYHDSAMGLECSNEQRTLYNLHSQW
ncbi:hypothetical protein HS088_TW10G00230 [Tripterygium wilfordii]|uniref:Uncharacterized protein n=2 Tax=Tripterygium wilfordii TaxID=458696 RepID=A0A7J7D4F9_TRIWF|nr:hypothetical protein HS088_TW10G00230 [Tripterygium wilfordii]